MLSSDLQLHQSLQFQGQRLGPVEVHLAAGQSNGEILPSLVDSEQIQLVVAPREKTTQHLLAPFPRAHDVQILSGIKSPFPLRWCTPDEIHGIATGATGGQGSLIHVGGHRLAEIFEGYSRGVHRDSLYYQAIVHDMVIELAEIIYDIGGRYRKRKFLE